MTSHDTVSLPATAAPLADSADVVICGGGLGGVAAAMAAARAGADTLLVDRNSYLGGVATAGMCCSIFNCFYTSHGELGTRGIAVEVADALAAAEGYGQAWHRHKGHIIYDLESAKCVLAELAEAAGVRLRLASPLAGVITEGQTVQGIVVESRTGPQALRGQVVIDATGDSDVAARAGVPLRADVQGLHSLCFRLGNVDVDRFVGHFVAHPEEYPAYMDVNWSFEEALAQYRECGTLLFPHGGGQQLQAMQAAKAAGALPATIGIHDTTDAAQMHALRRTGIVHIITGFVHFDGLDADLTTRSLVDGRRMAFVVAQAYREYLPGFERCFVTGTADNLGVRATRYLDGDFVFTDAMQQAGTRHPDCVGKLVGWDTVVKHPGPGAWSAQICQEDTFDLPYRCLLPRGAGGLLMGAGRSVSKEQGFLLRTMVQTMVVGQAAGTAAAVAARLGCQPRAVPIAQVQAELSRQGAQ